EPDGVEVHAGGGGADAGEGPDGAVGLDGDGRQGVAPAPGEADAVRGPPSVREDGDGAAGSGGGVGADDFAGKEHLVVDAAAPGGVGRGPVSEKVEWFPA